MIPIEEPRIVTATDGRTIRVVRVDVDDETEIVETKAADQCPDFVDFDERGIAIANVLLCWRKLDHDGDHLDVVDDLAWSVVEPDGEIRSDV